MTRLALTLSLLALVVTSSSADDKNGLPLVFSDDFTKGAARWQPTDPQAWKVEQMDGKSVYCQFKQSSYKPPHRSPFNFALIKDLELTDCVLEATVKSTVKDYPHRDVVVVFGYQGPSKFYYVHFGKKTDDHANQIFIVNDAPRVKISTKTNPGTPWTDAWHHVKVVRKVEDGTIEVYFDDMKSPAMTARDNTFASGQVGVGSFDDTSCWSDVKVFGKKR